jgi:RNA polymerase sigma factor (sigma-70 family)
VESFAVPAPSRLVADVGREGVSLEAFYEAELPRLVGTLTLYCGDRELAIELAQEAMARAWRDWNRVQHFDSPAGWVHRVGINLANSMWRRARLLGRVPRPRERVVEEDTGTALAVRAAVARLPRRQRTALVLRYFADLPSPEVAELMRCSPDTVRALTRQALHNLRTRSGLVDVQEDEA